MHAAVKVCVQLGVPIAGPAHHVIEVRIVHVQGGGVSNVGGVLGGASRGWPRDILIVVQDGPRSVG